MNIYPWTLANPEVLCPVCHMCLRKMTNKRLFHCSMCGNDSIQVGCVICDFNLCLGCVQLTFNSVNASETSALPSYELIVTENLLDDEYLPTYEEAVLQKLCKYTTEPG